MTPNNPEQNKPEPTESWEVQPLQLDVTGRLKMRCPDCQKEHTTEGPLEELLSQARSDALREAIEMTEKSQGCQVYEVLQGLKDLLTKPKDNGI